MFLLVTARSLQCHHCDDQRPMNGTTDMSPVGPATRPDGDAKTFHSVFSSCVTPHGRTNGACVPTYADCLCRTCGWYAYITSADLRVRPQYRFASKTHSTVHYAQDTCGRPLFRLACRRAHSPASLRFPAPWTAGLTAHRQHTCTARRTPSGVCHRAELQRSAQFQNLAGPPGEGPL